MTAALLTPQVIGYDFSNSVHMSPIITLKDIIKLI